MDPQSLDLQGFPEARVEMKVAPFRALTPFTNIIIIRIKVEMKVAPFRALTQSKLQLLFYSAVCSRNEGRPIQGISRSLHALILI